MSKKKGRMRNAHSDEVMRDSPERLWGKLAVGQSRLRITVVTAPSMLWLLGTTPGDCGGSRCATAGDFILSLITSRDTLVSEVLR